MLKRKAFVGCTIKFLVTDIISIEADNNHRVTLQNYP
jgi:hypothetical protein